MKKHNATGFSAGFRIVLFLFLTSCFTGSLIASSPGTFTGGKSEYSTPGLEKVFFTENKGQIHDGNFSPRPDVLFIGKTPKQKLTLTGSGVAHQLSRIEKSGPPQSVKDRFLRKNLQEALLQTYRVDMNWVDALPCPEPEGLTPLSWYENYYNLPYAEDGILEVRSFASVKLKEIYPGIDVHYYAKGDAIEYDYLIAPGADYRQIKVQIFGAETCLSAEGLLEMRTPFGIIAESAPRVFQENMELPSRWVIISNNIWGFEVDNFNPCLAMVIDPVIRVWGTFYGGDEDDDATDVKVDDDGNVFLYGKTQSTNNIATAGAHQTVHQNHDEAFLVKLNSNGTRLWATYYGGGNPDETRGLAVFNNTAIYISGSTASTTNIATAGTHSSSYYGSSNSFQGFLAKFNQSGVRQWGTYYGGWNDEYPNAIQVDNDGNIIMTGRTESSDSIAFNAPHKDTLSGSADCFIAKFSSNGEMIWATYFGGNDFEEAHNHVLDGSGNIYLVGQTMSSSNFATAGSHQVSYGGGMDGFAAKFNSLGVLQWATYYGGAEEDFFAGISMDDQGNLFASGFTASNSGIATAGSHKPSAGAGIEGVVVKFNNDGVRVWGTYYGGSGDDYVVRTLVDETGDVIIAGATSSNSQIATTIGHQPSFGGAMDGFVGKLSKNGVLRWASYYGGSDMDWIWNIAYAGNRNFYVCGYTSSTNQIASSGAHQTGNAGQSDAFVAKFLDRAVWTGNSDHLWSNNANWDIDTVPYETMDVLIPSGRPNNPTLDDGVTVNDLEVEAGAVLTISSGNFFKIEGLMLNEGTINVNAGGSLLQKFYSTLAGTGTYNVQRTIPAGSTGFRFVGSPISNHSVSGFGVSPTGTNGGQIEATFDCDTTNAAQGSPYGNILQLQQSATSTNNCAQELWFVKSSGTLENGRGYAMTTSGGQTLTFTGTVNNGNVSQTGLGRQAGFIHLDLRIDSATYGWHLVSNPYPSPITLAAADLTSQGFDAQLQFWQTSGTHYGSWQSVDPLVSHTIAVGQAFQIRKTTVGGSATFTFNNDMRAVGNPTFYRQTLDREQYLKIALHADGQIFDQTMVYFHPDAATDFDPNLDASRLGGHWKTPLLYTRKQGERMSYHALPGLTQETTVDLGFSKGEFEAFYLSFEGLETLNAEVWLLDRFTEKWTRVTSHLQYPFSFAAGLSADRFQLWFSTKTGLILSSPESSKETGISLYPNPTNGTVWVRIPDSEKYRTIEVTDLSGKQLAQYPTEGKAEVQIDLSSWQSGIYLVRISGAGRPSVHKLIKH